VRCARALAATVLAATSVLVVHWSTIHLFIIEGCVLGGLFAVLALVVFGFALGAKHEREKLSADEWILVETRRALHRFDQIDAMAEAGMRDIASRYRR
jgi:hypothetical protein